MSSTTTEEFGADELATILSDMGFPVTAEEIAAEPDRTFADLGLDSLAVLDMFSAVEKRLRVKIEDDEAFGLDTPGAALSRIAALRAEVA